MLHPEPGWSRVHQREIRREGAGNVTSFESRLISIGELLSGDKAYTVPEFQRDYSWTETEVEELWTDLMASIQEDRPQHFLGSIVVHRPPEGPLVVIDGQQRLATVSLLMCVIRDICLEGGDERRASIANDYVVGSRDFATLKSSPRLTLNDTNNPTYQDYLVEHHSLDSLRDHARKRTTRVSNRLVVRAYLQLNATVHREMTQATDSTDFLIQIMQCVSERFVAIVITVPNLEDAYLIFETLNDRGLELTVADLLKNHLFSRASNRLLEVKRAWEEMNSFLGTAELPRFIRHYWVSSHGLVREKELYRLIAKSVRSSGESISLATHLRGSARVYGALENPNDVLWAELGPDFEEDLRSLNTLNVTQCYPVLLAAKETLNQQMFKILIRMLLVISLRYSVICGMGTGTLEQTYSDLCQYLRAQKPKSPKQLFERVAQVYPSDEDFSRSFEEKVLRNGRIARYILLELNNEMMSTPELRTNPNAAKVNLEHILPQNPSIAWAAAVFDDPDELSEYVHRLGNMTLLQAADNREIGNAAFVEKRDVVYAKSMLQITQQLSSYTEWSRDAIEERQRKMARLACKVWRLDY